MIGGFKSAVAAARRLARSGSTVSTIVGATATFALVQTGSVRWANPRYAWTGNMAAGLREAFAYLRDLANTGSARSMAVVKRQSWNGLAQGPEEAMMTPTRRWR